MGQESTPSLGSWIRASRKAVGWTQAELGSFLGGVSQATVSQWERVKAAPGEAMHAEHSPDGIDTLRPSG